MRSLPYICLLFLSCAPLWSRQVDVRPVAASGVNVARLQSQVEPAFEHVTKLTGLSDDADLTLVVVGGARSFSELAARDGVGMAAEGVLGYAIPAQRRIVLNVSGIRDRQMDPVGVLRHEIAHLVMGSSLRVAHPLWFEEGVAQYVESMALNELRENASASPFVDFKGLGDLDAALREEGRAGSAYVEAREVVRLIASKYGDDAFKQLMQLLAGGKGPFDEAFKQATGHTLGEFERFWLENYRARASSRTAGFFGRNLWWMLLGLVALLLPLCVLLIRMRGKSHIKRWEDMDKHYPSDPTWSYDHDEPEGFVPEDPDAWKQG